MAPPPPTRFCPCEQSFGLGYVYPKDLPTFTFTFQVTFTFSHKPHIPEKPSPPAMTSTTTDPDRELNHYELVHTASGAPALVVDHDDTGDMPLLYTMRQYPKRVLYILVTLPAILLVGYDVVIVSALASMPYFE